MTATQTESQISLIVCLTENQVLPTGSLQDVFATHWTNLDYF